MEEEIHDDKTDFSETDQDELSEEDVDTPEFAKNTKGTTLILPPSLFPNEEIDNDYQVPEEPEERREIKNQVKNSKKEKAKVVTKREETPIVTKQPEPKQYHKSVDNISKKRVKKEPIQQFKYSPVQWSPPHSIPEDRKSRNNKIVEEEYPKQQDIEQNEVTPPRDIPSTKRQTTETDSLMYLLADPKKLRKVTDPTPIPDDEIRATPVRNVKSPRPQTPIEQFTYQNRSPKNEKTPSPQQASLRESPLKQLSPRSETQSTFRPPERRFLSPTSTHLPAENNDLINQNSVLSKKETSPINNNRQPSIQRSQPSPASANRSPVNKTPVNETREPTPTPTKTEKREESPEFTEKWKEREDLKRQRGDDIRRTILLEEQKEKRELIYEFWLMEQNKVPVSKKYTLDDDLAEMRFEYSKLKSEEDIKSKVRTGWNMFQCANSLAELINQRLNPFDVPMDGWTEEVDKEKDKYEPHFRKLYKSLSCRFNIKPGTQIAMMYISQFLVFIVPRLLKKFTDSKKKDPPPQKAPEYPWEKQKAKSDPKPRQTDRKTVTKSVQIEKQVEALKKQMEFYQKQIEQQKAALKAQQELIQKYSQLPTNNNVTKIFTSPPSKITNLSPEKKSSPSVITEGNSQSTQQIEELEDELASVAGTTDDNTDLPPPADSLGAISAFVPMIDRFTQQKNEKPKQIDMQLYNEKPEIPESYLAAEEKKKSEEVVRKSSRKSATMVL